MKEKELREIFYIGILVSMIGGFLILFYQKAVETAPNSFLAQIVLTTFPTVLLTTVLYILARFFVLDKEKPASASFKGLIQEMANGFPSWRFSGMVEQVIKTKAELKDLLNRGVLLEEKHEKGKRYGLGTTGVMLANSFNVGDLTKKVVSLTKVIVILTIIMVGIGVLQILLP